jgi:hypothetical protein
MDDLPQRWQQDHPAKGLWLPDGSIITWQIDEGGNPTHDQGAKVINVSLVECDALLIREDGRITRAERSTPPSAEDFQRAVMRYDSRLWVTDSDWDFR